MPVSEQPPKVTNTNDAGERHLEIDDSVSIVDVSPIGSEPSTDERGRFEVRDEGTLIWSIAYDPESRTRDEARRIARRIAGAYSLGKRVDDSTASRF